MSYGSGGCGGSGSDGKWGSHKDGATLALLHTSHIDATKMVPHLHTSHKAGDIDGCHLTALTYHMNHIDGCHLTAAATLALAHKQHKCHLQFATTQAT